MPSCFLNETSRGGRLLVTDELNNLYIDCVFVLENLLNIYKYVIANLVIITILSSIEKLEFINSKF